MLTSDVRRISGRELIELCNIYMVTLDEIALDSKNLWAREKAHVKKHQIAWLNLAVANPTYKVA